MGIYKKFIKPHENIYIAHFIKNKNKPSILFIHGGPGFNSGIIEYLIDNQNYFHLLDYNIIIYDQRNCGKSKKLSPIISHQDNINDLNEILNYLSSNNIDICGLMGHSYGAKLLYDYYKSFSSKLPSIFISTANSILIPRLNNLILDLAFLKKSHPSKYNTTYQNLNNLDINKLWELSEELTPIFLENTERPHHYWANLESYEMVKIIQKEINNPANMDVFIQIRKNLYSDVSNFSVDIPTLETPYLWINGFHDFIMNGSSDILRDNNITTFYKSAHYPHIEENDRFCETVNEFFKNL